jgi:esterase/lipase superfamily enzyme
MIKSAGQLQDQIMPYSSIANIPHLGGIMPSGAGTLDTTVYFATNRRPDPAAEGGYGAQIVDPADPAAIAYAVVPVSNVKLNDESSGILGTVTGLHTGDFAGTVSAELEATNRNLLVLIHGFDNSFADAIRRAAFNREWFAASGIAAADTTVVAFSWPSAGELFSNLPDPPQQAYLADLAMAGNSGIHLAAFLRNILAVIESIRASDRRAFLLAHSMGNHALASAIPPFLGATACGILPTFNDAILAAADEVSTIFQTPSTDTKQLAKLADRISVYHSLRDVAMDLSMSVNHNIRLGYNGPNDKEDEVKYPPEQFRCVDCTGVFDYPGLIPPDATHQYYRRSGTVRSDITKVMSGGAVTAGVSALSALPFGL